jgi:hypothetical protein
MDKVTIPEKPTRGGSRPGAGRPPGEKKVRLWYRVPEQHAEQIDKLITTLLKTYPDARSMEPAIRPAETESHNDSGHHPVRRIMYR